MPHITIKHFPRSFSAAEKKRLSEALTKVVLDNFDTHEGAVSIALEPVPRHEWSESVVGPELTERADLVIKPADYERRS